MTYRELLGMLKCMSDDQLDQSVQVSLCDRQTQQQMAVLIEDRDSGLVFLSDSEQGFGWDIQSQE